jgi:predicted nucleic acid-binding protein
MPRRKPPSAPHKVVYWDANLYLAWLKHEVRPFGELEGTLVSLDHIYAGRSDLVLSRAIPEQEVPLSRLPAERRKIYEQVLRRPNITQVDYEVPILALTRELLDYYQSIDLLFMDALHLATAIIKGVDAFYTFDSGKRGGANLLSLDGNVMGHALRVCRPPFEQVPLLFSPGGLNFDLDDL